MKVGCLTQCSLSWATNSFSLSHSPCVFLLAGRAQGCLSPAKMMGPVFSAVDGVGLPLFRVAYSKRERKAGREKERGGGRLNLYLNRFYGYINRCYETKGIEINCSFLHTSAWTWQHNPAMGHGSWMRRGFNLFKGLREKTLYQPNAINGICFKLILNGTSRYICPQIKCYLTLESQDQSVWH